MSVTFYIFSGVKVGQSKLILEMKVIALNFVFIVFSLIIIAVVTVIWYFLSKQFKNINSLIMD